MSGAEVDERVSPRTEAGRRLFTDNEPMDMWESDGVTPEDIAAIEAQAIALDRAELAAAVEDLEAFDGYPGPRVEKAAVLALIEGEKGADHAD